MFLSNAAIKNRTTVFVGVVLIVFAGAFSYATLPRESAPDVNIPKILVTTVNEGVSPVDVKNGVTAEIEQELSGLKSLKEVTSTSQEGLSVITVEFESDVDIDDALQRVKDKVDLARSDVDADAEDSVVKEINVSEFPIMMINISGNVSPVQLKRIADQLEDAIEAVPGVLGVDVLGALERVIRIEVVPEKVANYGLRVEELLALIPSEHVNRSAGGLDTEGIKFNVRVPAEFQNPERIDHLILAMREGKPIYLSDIGRVADSFKDRLSFSRLDGKSSVTVSVRKRTGANIVAIADRVKGILDVAREQVPAGVNFTLTSDRSDDIRMMVSDLENNIISGLILVVGVLVLFMGLRLSLIVGLAIPLSMLMSFAILQAMDITLNMIVLFSLILALGMLVDNAIVIVENIYRHGGMGKNRIRSAMDGTAEVAWPVITSTATTVAAFAPLLFWPGVMGDFMSYLPLTVIVVLTSSLFVALIINPVICSIAARPAPKDTKPRTSRIVKAYRSILNVSVQHAVTTLFVAVCLLVGIFVTYTRLRKGTEFFPDPDPKYLVVNLRSPQGTNISESDRLAMLVEKELSVYRSRPGLQRDVFKHVVTNVGSAGEGFFGGSSGGPHIANINVMFQDFEDREVPSASFINQFRSRLGDMTGTEVKVDKEEHGPPVGAPVTVRIIGDDLDVLKQLSGQAMAMISDTPGLINLRSDLEAERPEIVFVPDRRRARYLGVDPATVGMYLKTGIFGTTVGSFRQYNDDYDITIRMPLIKRTNLEDLQNLQVPNARGVGVPLSSIGNFRYAPGLGTIHRIDQKQVVTLTGDNAQGAGEEAVLKEVQSRLSQLEMPPGYELRYAGQKEEQDKSQTFLLKAGLIAVLTIVGILVAQFNTLMVPLIIMTTVLLSTIGVFTGLLALDLAFIVIMTGVGVISLAGVVVNNAIVLLDYTRQLQRRGLELVEAVLQAGATRLRPVLLTATTTILGLIPMVTGWSMNFRTMEFSTRSESSQWWQPMATAVVFGLAFATLLTLLVVPALYVLLYRLAGRFGLGGLHRSGEEETATTVELEDY
jgi:multidrug efflux pump subunit AcrB